jgi:hypothetical protein
MYTVNDMVSPAAVIAALSKANVHAGAETAHGAISRQEVVAARGWLWGVLKRIEASRMFNAAFNPVSIQ